MEVQLFLSYNNKSVSREFKCLVQTACTNSRTTIYLADEN